MSPDPESAPSPIDPRPRRLLERYAALVGGLVMESGPELLQVELPAPERRLLGLEAGSQIGLTPAALDEDPEAEILVVGSALLDRLIKAVRLRGGRDDRGLLAPTVGPDQEAPTLDLPTGGAEARALETELIALPIGQLVARVTIHAGARIEERLVESSVIDLSVGAMVPPALAALCADSAGSPGSTPPAEAKAVASRAVDELLPLLFADLERRLEPDLTRLRRQADQDCATEVSRLDGYYQRMVDEVEPDEESEASARKDTIRAQQQRRKSEEETRHRVGATIHPVHLVEWRVLSQRVTWELRAPNGHSGTISSTRSLSGDTAWRLVCPNCGQAPTEVQVCQGDHVVCPGCGARCTVCGEGACERHGLLQCSVEGHPVCRAHGGTCEACGRVHCATHAVRCAAADHDVCTGCGHACARCGKAVCSTHAVHTGAAAPRGSRWLCADCAVFCEGGNDEPVGLDEVVRCTSCERHICEVHQVKCAVDGQPHCSRHLRRSDASGRLVCEQHRVECSKAAMEVVASDEVAECRTCGSTVCTQHSAECYADRERHCVDHLVQPADARGRMACPRHRSVCHVDGVTFSLTGTIACPVCQKAACPTHRRECEHCGRAVCTRDLKDRRCITCRRLELMADPADELITAALAANGGDPPSTRGWRAGRDATHTVVELELSWLRTLVFSVPHGDTTPATVMAHGLLGSRRRR